MFRRLLSGLPVWAVLIATWIVDALYGSDVALYTFTGLVIFIAIIGGVFLTVFTRDPDLYTDDSGRIQMEKRP